MEINAQTKANTTDSIVTYFTEVKNGNYGLEIITRCLQESIKPFYDTAYYPVAVEQEFIFKKNNEVLNTVNPPSPKFSHQTKYGNLMGLIKVSYTRVFITTIRGKEFYLISAYLCNGSICPDIVLVYTFEGELVLLQYLTETESFIYESKGV
jgi:DNA-binding transcriptional regulator WhiA